MPVEEIQTEIIADYSLDQKFFSDYWVYFDYQRDVFNNLSKFTSVFQPFEVNKQSTFSFHNWLENENMNTTA